jgi:hypothetical protein
VNITPLAPRFVGSLLASALFGVGLVSLIACSDRDVFRASDVGAPGPPGPAETPNGPLAKYVVSSLVFSPEGTISYVSLLDSLQPQTIDYDQAREFSGLADMWVHEGAVFIADAESLTMRKFSVTSDGLETPRLEEQGSLSFAAYGLTDFGFWRNTFVAPNKAYLTNGASEFIIWDPEAMEILGSVDLPAFEPAPGMQVFTGYSDRAAVVRDGLLYQPLYFTDESFFLYAADSRIVVFDVQNDTLVDVIEAPCPGLDYATAGPDGALYFSSWIYAAGAAVVLDQPPTCVFSIPPQGEPSMAFRFADITGGREGAALRSLGGDRAILSVLHGERLDRGATVDPSEFTFGPNWRFWSYDLRAGTASEIDAIDWNAGAEYAFDIDDKTFMLVAAGDYSSTTVYELGELGDPRPVFDTRGWATRLFSLE